MFLLIRTCLSIFAWSIDALHSTMFLLILDHSDGAWAVGDFTFHNVSINTATSQACQARHSGFTFHNVSINTKSVNVKELWGKGLYIPQCFY